MKIAYVRVSTIDQNEQRQMLSLQSYNIEKWYVEKVSAKDTNRPKLNEMIDFARSGDYIYIDDFSRLARSTKDLLNIVDILQRKKIILISHKENIDTSTANGKLMLTLIGAINEFERQNNLERQREGISIAKSQGKYKGRKPIKIDNENFDILHSKYLRRELTKVEFAKSLNISRPTLDKFILSKKSVNSNVW